MQLTKIAGVALALLLVTGTAAAMPGAAPAQADENTDDANETAEDGPPAGASERGADRPGPAADNGDRGPPADRPSQVPDFVGDIHDHIGQFLAGDLAGSPGERISELTPDAEATDHSDSDTGAPDATATPTAQADA